MRATVPEKLLKIVEEIDEHGHANLTRLTVLKKWFERPGRAKAFALWLAAQASAVEAPTRGEGAKLFLEARHLFAGLDFAQPDLDPVMVRSLHDRLRDFQDEHVNQQWGPVRIIKNWNLMLVESGLAIYLWRSAQPFYAYKLAADYCQYHDSRYGSGLSGPSRAKIGKIIRFVTTLEAHEAKASERTV